MLSTLDFALIRINELGGCAGFTGRDESFAFGDESRLKFLTAMISPNWLGI